eukprot:TRINITY_DN67_c5_g1_i1.p1 TRINITY_DN67_c5_g1~~TRINITY_DN67_c5_g1_i1.p1  ORF type:complete len:462 (-),score=126.39 TRINITY_DN67_c5_g1_i1:182-1516(-)
MEAAEGAAAASAAAPPPADGSSSSFDVEQQLRNVDADIKKAETDIRALEARIREGNTALAAGGTFEGRDGDHVRVHVDALMREEEQLRNEEDQLRDKHWFLTKQAMQPPPAPGGGKRKRQGSQAAKAKIPSCFSFNESNTRQVKPYLTAALRSIGINCDVQIQLPSSMNPAIKERTYTCFEWPVTQERKGKRGTKYAEEDEAAPQLRKHIKAQLVHFGVRFNTEGGFKMVDVHTRDDARSFAVDTSIGDKEFSGGADAAVIPFAATQESWSEQARVLFDLKPPGALSIAQLTAQQGKLLLIGSMHYSCHPAIVVMTDGKDFVIYSVRENGVGIFSTLPEKNVDGAPPPPSATEAVQFVAHYLIRVCSASPAFSVETFDSAGAPAPAPEMQSALTVFRLVKQKVMEQAAPLIEQLEVDLMLPGPERARAMAATTATWQAASGLRR